MSAQSTVRVTMANMLLQLAASLGWIALVAAGGTSLTSVSNLHGGSYAYGVDHDSYGAWYGTAQPSLYGGLNIGHVGLGESHGSLYDHATALPHDDYGYTTYGAGYGHGDYATSYQNVDMTSYGGKKILHAGHAVHHGNGATSHSKIVQKFGHSGLYDGLDSYAGGYGHGHYAGHGISQQNFNLKSYVQPNFHAEHIPHHETISYAPHHVTVPYIATHALEDFSGYSSLGGLYGPGDYSHVLDYSHSYIPHATYNTYGSPHLYSYANNGHFGYGHALPYYYR